MPPAAPGPQGNIQLGAVQVNRKESTLNKVIQVTAGL